ncbi:MAG: RNA-binding S4 domain-containing protein [Erysipelothrix sp.]|jgi:ribosomal 50S subunit-recycling heat shock protein|nr:RNA-binding S4 domain-containing protein [Erysipelothrix sp.]
MRIDKFLKISRVLKKRSVAKKLADFDKVIINGKLAKPSSLVKVGDVVNVTFGEKQLTFIIRMILTHPKKDEVDQLIEIIDASLSIT